MTLDHNWQYIMAINPFTKPEDIEKIEELTKWDLLITYRDGTKVSFDKHTGSHQNVFWNDIEEITEAQDKKYFSYRLRTLMERQGLRQEDLAAIVGTSQVMISRYMNGMIPNAYMLRKIARSLDCSMDDFFYSDY